MVLQAEYHAHEASLSFGLLLGSIKLSFKCHTSDKPLSTPIFAAHSAFTGKMGLPPYFGLAVLLWACVVDSWRKPDEAFSLIPSAMPAWLAIFLLPDILVMLNCLPGGDASAVYDALVGPPATIVNFFWSLATHPALRRFTRRGLETGLWLFSRFVALFYQHVVIALLRWFLAQLLVLFRKEWPNADSRPSPRPRRSRGSFSSRSRPPQMSPPTAGCPPSSAPSSGSGHPSVGSSAGGSAGSSGSGHPSGGQTSGGSAGSSGSGHPSAGQTSGGSAGSSGSTSSSGASGSSGVPSSAGTPGNSTSGSTGPSGVPSTPSAAPNAGGSAGSPTSPTPTSAPSAPASAPAAGGSRSPTPPPPMPGVFPHSPSGSAGTPAVGAPAPSSPAPQRPSGFPESSPTTTGGSEPGPGAQPSSDSAAPSSTPEPVPTARASADIMAGWSTSSTWGENRRLVSQQRRRKLAPFWAPEQAVPVSPLPIQPTKDTVLAKPAVAPKSAARPEPVVSSPKEKLSEKSSKLPEVVTSSEPATTTTANIEVPVERPAETPVVVANAPAVLSTASKDVSKPSVEVAKATKQSSEGLSGTKSSLTAMAGKSSTVRAKAPVEASKSDRVSFKKTQTKRVRFGTTTDKTAVEPTKVVKPSEPAVTSTLAPATVDVSTAPWFKALVEQDQSVVIEHISAGKDISALRDIAEAAFSRRSETQPEPKQEVSPATVSEPATTKATEFVAPTDILEAPWFQILAQNDRAVILEHIQAGKDISGLRQVAETELSRLSKAEQEPELPVTADSIPVDFYTAPWFQVLGSTDQIVVLDVASSGNVPVFTQAQQLGESDLSARLALQLCLPAPAADDVTLAKHASIVSLPAEHSEATWFVQLSSSEKFTVLCAFWEGKDLRPYATECTERRRQQVATTLHKGEKLAAPTEVFTVRPSTVPTVVVSEPVDNSMHSLPADSPAPASAPTEAPASSAAPSPAPTPAKGLPKPAAKSVARPIDFTFGSASKIIFDGPSLAPPSAVTGRATRSQPRKGARPHRAAIPLGLIPVQLDTNVLIGRSAGEVFGITLEWMPKAWKAIVKAELAVVDAEDKAVYNSPEVVNSLREADAIVKHILEWIPGVAEFSGEYRARSRQSWFVTPNNYMIDKHHGYNLRSQLAFLQTTFEHNMWNPPMDIVVPRLIRNLLKLSDASGYPLEAESVEATLQWRAAWHLGESWQDELARQLLG